MKKKEARALFLGLFLSSYRDEEREKKGKEGSWGKKKENNFHFNFLLST